MRSKKLLCLLITAVMVGCVLFTGCTKKKDDNGPDKTQTNETQTNDTKEDETVKNTVDKLKDVFTKFDKNDSWGTSAKIITLADEDVVIETEGTYVISGTLKDGQIRINVSDEEKVQLVLKGVDITCASSAAIFVENADKVAITLAEGTTNTVTDGGNIDITDADGCIYSKDDLSINGSGTLIVNGKVSNGIDCNNDIKIVSGNIEVNAVNNGIKAKESISIKDGNIKVSAEDAIKASNNSDDTEGTFYMEGGELELNATDDAITATISITVAGGKITAKADGKTTNCDGEEKIAEGCLIKK